MNIIHNKLLMKILLSIAVATILLMTGFEIVKQFVHSDITIWESHAATIIFTTLASVIITYVALHKHYSVLRILSGFIPVCAWCKKIRDEEGKWISFETYLGTHSQTEFTHGICNECEHAMKEQGQAYRDLRSRTAETMKTNRAK